MFRLRRLHRIHCWIKLRDHCAIEGTLDNVARLFFFIFACELVRGSLLGLTNELRRQFLLCSWQFCTLMKIGVNWYIFSRTLVYMHSRIGATKAKTENSDRRRRRRASRTGRPICEHLKIPSDITVSYPRNRRRRNLSAWPFAKPFGCGLVVTVSASSTSVFTAPSLNDSSSPAYSYKVYSLSICIIESFVALQAP